MENFHVVVRTLQHGNLEVSLPQEATVQQLKDKIREQISVDTSSQRILYRGRELRDGDAALNSSGIPQNAVLHMVSAPIPRHPRPNSPMFPQGIAIPIGMSVSTHIETGGNATAGAGDTAERNGAPRSGEANTNAGQNGDGRTPGALPEGLPATARVMGPFSIPINVESMGTNDEERMSQVASSIMEQILQSGMIPGGEAGRPTVVAVQQRSGQAPMNPSVDGGRRPHVHLVQNNIHPSLTTRGELNGRLSIELLDLMLNRIEQQNMERDPGPPLLVATSQAMDSHRTAWAQAAFRFLESSRSILSESNLNSETFNNLNRIFHEAGIETLQRRVSLQSHPIACDFGDDSEGEEREITRTERNFENIAHDSDSTASSVSHFTPSILPININDQAGIEQESPRNASSEPSESNAQGIDQQNNANNQPEGNENSSQRIAEWFRNVDMDDLSLVASVVLGELAGRTMSILQAPQSSSSLHQTQDRLRGSSLLTASHNSIGSNALVLRMIERLQSLSSLTNVNRRELSSQINLVSGYLVRVSSVLSELARYLNYLPGALENQNYYLFGLQPSFLTLSGETVRPHRSLVSGVQQQHGRRPIGQIRIGRRSQPQVSNNAPNAINVTPDTSGGNPNGAGVSRVGMFMMSMPSHNGENPNIGVQIRNTQPPPNMPGTDATNRPLDQQSPTPDDSASIPQGSRSERQLPTNVEHSIHVSMGELPENIRELPAQIATAISSISQSGIDFSSIPTQIANTVSEALRNEQNSTNTRQSDSGSIPTGTQVDPVQVGLNAAGSEIRRQLQNMLQSDDVARPFDTIRTEFGIDLSGGVLDEARRSQNINVSSDVSMHQEQPSESNQRTNQNTSLRNEPDGLQRSQDAPTSENHNDTVDNPRSTHHPDSSLEQQAENLKPSPAGLGSKGLRRPRVSTTSASINRSKFSDQEKNDIQQEGSSSGEISKGTVGTSCSKVSETTIRNSGTRPALPPRKRQSSKLDSSDTSIRSQNTSSRAPTAPPASGFDMTSLMNAAGPLLGQLMGAGSSSNAGGSNRGGTEQIWDQESILANELSAEDATRWNERLTKDAESRKKQGSHPRESLSDAYLASIADQKKSGSLLSILGED